LIRRALAAVTLVACTLGLSACGGDDSSGDSKDLPTKTIDITVSGDSVTPNGDRVEVKVNQPIELVVKADAEGEIHVHSDPEHEYEYGAGTTTLPTFTIDKPGIVTVESHTLEKTIVQLEVK
jgi:ABC-type glycerol-3-phosphate transport system substrate-binding protein